MSSPNPQHDYGENEVAESKYGYGDADIHPSKRPMKPSKHLHTYCGGTTEDGRGHCTGLWNIWCCSHSHPGGGGYCPEGGTKGQTTKDPLEYNLVIKDGCWLPDEQASQAK